MVESIEHHRGLPKLFWAGIVALGLGAGPSFVLAALGCLGLAAGPQSADLDILAGGTIWLGIALLLAGLIVSLLHRAG